MNRSPYSGSQDLRPSVGDPGLVPARKQFPESFLHDTLRWPVHILQQGAVPLDETPSVLYTFDFFDDDPIRVEVPLEPAVHGPFDGSPDAAPEWTRLEYEQCGNCPLRPEDSLHCPLALRLQGLVERFGDRLSYEKVRLKVVTRQRTVRAETTLQDALRSLMGVIMPMSGCPHLAPLRPMARFHLPVGSPEETTFRAVGAYLMGQYFIARQGGTPDWYLDGMPALYEEIHRVNVDFSQRLAVAAGSDAAPNSLTRLDLFTFLVPRSLEQRLEEFSPLFDAYLVAAAAQPYDETEMEGETGD